MRGNEVNMGLSSSNNINIGGDSNTASQNDVLTADADSDADADATAAKFAVDSAIIANIASSATTTTTTKKNETSYSSSCTNSSNKKTDLGGQREKIDQISSQSPEAAEIDPIRSKKRKVSNSVDLIAHCA